MSLAENYTAQEIQTKPRVSFIGTGWIGLNRMKAIMSEKIVSADAVADIYSENLEKARVMAPDARTFHTLEEIVDRRPKGLVIATPSALHAAQTIYALEHGISVFCQKPLGRSAQEAKSAVDTAKKYNKLLGVDFSYRFTQGMQKINALIKSGCLGHIFAANLVFHNAYGPDKNWFYNPQLSGGGCVIDLGSHLIDLALWVLNFPVIEEVSSSLFSSGKVLENPDETTEDYATARITTQKGTVIQLSCSWNLQAGQDAIIEATFYGTEGGASFRNVNGSFYDFEAFRFYSKIQKEILCLPPDDWGGKAAVSWAKRLANGEGFNDDAAQFIEVAKVIDRIYKRKTL